MVLKLPEGQKQMLWMFENSIYSIFHFFANFWLSKLKTFSGKARQCFWNLSIKTPFLAFYLEYGFHFLFDLFRQYSLGRCSHQNFGFPKKSPFIAHLKAHNESFSKWACFLNLEKRFISYSNFFACKVRFFRPISEDL